MGAVPDSVSQIGRPWTARPPRTACLCSETRSVLAAFRGVPVLRVAEFGAALVSLVTHGHRIGHDRRRCAFRWRRWGWPWFWWPVGISRTARRSPASSIRPIACAGTGNRGRPLNPDPRVGAVFFSGSDLHACTGSVLHSAGRQPGADRRALPGRGRAQIGLCARPGR